jgi:hypothetical protein
MNKKCEDSIIILLFTLGICAYHHLNLFVFGVEATVFSLQKFHCSIFVPQLFLSGLFDDKHDQ